MRKLALVALFSLVSCRTMTDVVPTGFLDRQVTAGGRSFPYAVYVPRDYDAARRWPLILFLHGAGERGTDGLRPTQVGLGTAVRFHPERFPAIVVFPQVPADERWLDAPADAAVEAVAEVTRDYAIDRERIYVTGLSMGGYGAWHLAMAQRDLFAAAIVVCGGLLPHESARSVRQSPLTMGTEDPYAAAAVRLQHLPIRIFHGAKDLTVPVDESRRMAEALRSAGAADVQYVEFPDIGHGSWDAAYDREELWLWLFAQRKKK